MAVRHGCSFTGVLQLLQNVNFYDSKSRGSKKCCPINKMISYVIVKKITLKWTLQPALLFHPVLRWSNFSSKQDSLGSTSLGEVSRLQPAEEIGLKLRIGQNKPLLVFFGFLQVGGFCKVQLLLPHPWLAWVHTFLPVCLQDWKCYIIKLSTFVGTRTSWALFAV